MPGRQPRRLVSPLTQDGISPVLFRRQRFLMKLAAYRPLLVLVGIWAALMAIAVVAYSQLLHTSTQLPAPVPPKVADAPSASPPATTAPVEPSIALPTAQEPGISSPDQSGVPGPPAVEDEDGIVLWTWGALIGGCALGCWLISHQLKAPPRSKMAKKKPLTGRKPTHSGRKPVAVTSQAPTALPTPKRLAPYDPTQALMKPPPARAARARKSPQPTRAAASSPQVTVVAEAVQHRLDWPEDSLINTVDVRQKRSLSSFL